LFTLKEIGRNRRLFTSIVILTKNPALLCEEPYLSIVSDREMQPFTVQISCAFWRDDVRAFYEPNTPSVESRLNALRRLFERGVDVELRIDPLFPSARIDEKLRRHMPLPFYSIPEAQTEDDLINLVRFAKAAGVNAVVAKPLKVAISKRAQRCKDWFAQIFADACDGKRTVSGGSWRLPRDYQNALTQSLAEICTAEGVIFKHCKHDVLCRK
jgi:DNA repair photolyase